MWWLRLCIFIHIVRASCPDCTQKTSLEGCEGTLTRVLRNAPEGSCNTDFTIWVANAGAASEVGNAILSGDFTAETLTVESGIMLPTGAIGTDDIAAGAVTTSKIGGGAVTNVKLASKTISADKIADNTLTAAQIGPNAIEHDELANNAVTTANIVNDAVTSAKLAHSISIGNDLTVGRELHVNGDATFDDNLNVYYVVASIWSQDSTKITRFDRKTVDKK